MIYPKKIQQNNFFQLFNNIEDFIRIAGVSNRRNRPARVDRRARACGAEKSQQSCAIGKQNETVVLRLCLWG
jgi:hypothetical protein